MKHFIRLSLIGALFASFLIISTLPALADCHENDDPDCPIDPPQSVEVDPDSVEAEGVQTELDDPGALEGIESDLPGDGPTFIDPVPLAPRSDPPPIFTQLEIPMRWQQPSDVSCGVQALGMAFEGLGDGSPTSPAILDFLQSQGMMYHFGTGVEELAFTAHNFGYVGSVPFHEWDLAQLQAELAQGRAPIVTLGANGPGLPGHFVALTGISEDGSWVSYNDPILGKQVVTMEEFIRLWALQGYSGVAVRKTVPAGEFDPIPWVAFIAGLMAIISLTPSGLKRMGIGGGLVGHRERRRARTAYKGRNKGLRERLARRHPDTVVVPKSRKIALKESIEAREFAAPVIAERGLLHKGKEFGTKFQLFVSRLLKPKTLAERISDRLLPRIAAPSIEERWYTKLPKLKTPVKVAIAGSAIIATGLLMTKCGANFDNPCPMVGPGILLPANCQQGEGIFSMEIPPEATSVFGEFTPAPTVLGEGTPIDIFLTPVWEPETPKPGVSTPQQTVQFEQPTPGTTQIHAAEATPQPATPTLTYDEKVRVLEIDPNTGTVSDKSKKEAETILQAEQEGLVENPKRPDPLNDPDFDFRVDGGFAEIKRPVSSSLRDLEDQASDIAGHILGYGLRENLKIIIDLRELTLREKDEFLDLLSKLLTDYSGIDFLNR